MLDEVRDASDVCDPQQGFHVVSFEIFRFVKSGYANYSYYVKYKNVHTL